MRIFRIGWVRYRSATARSRRKEVMTFKSRMTETSIEGSLVARCLHSWAEYGPATSTEGVENSLRQKSTLLTRLLPRDACGVPAESGRTGSHPGTYETANKGCAKGVDPMKIRFSISSLMLSIALSAVSIGWWIDHRHLSDEMLELNTECGDLFRTAMHTSRARLFFDGVGPPQRSYDFQIPEDRDEYRKHYSHSRSPFMGRILTREENRANRK